MDLKVYEPKDGKNWVIENSFLTNISSRTDEPPPDERYMYMLWGRRKRGRVRRMLIFYGNTEQAIDRKLVRFANKSRIVESIERDE